MLLYRLLNDSWILSFVKLLKCHLISWLRIHGFVSLYPFSFCNLIICSLVQLSGFSLFKTYFYSLQDYHFLSSSGKENSPSNCYAALPFLRSFSRRGLPCDQRYLGTPCSNCFGVAWLCSWSVMCCGRRWRPGWTIWAFCCRCELVCQLWRLQKHQLVAGYLFLCWSLLFTCLRY